MKYVTDSGKVLTDEVLDEMAKEYEEGTWSGAESIRLGRPKLFDEELTTVSFKIPKSQLNALEIVTKNLGESKSDFFREALATALLAKAR